MEEQARVYRSKVLLFGEYALMAGSPALGIPFGHFTAGLGFTARLSEELRAAKSNETLRTYFRDYLMKQRELQDVIDMARLEYDLEEGLFLDSDIPVRSGLGSSGALCASLYGQYAFEPLLLWDGQTAERWKELRQVFIAMETWFHGRSSGFDALISYLDRPLMLQNDGTVSHAGIILPGSGGYSFFLAGTGPRQLAPDHLKVFMDGFFGVNHDSENAKQLASENKACIKSLLEGNSENFISAFKSLSGFQLERMEVLIPQALRTAWADGLNSDEFYMKICGSGGGGYFLGLTLDPCNVAEHLKSKGLDIILIGPDFK